MIKISCTVYTECVCVELNLEGISLYLSILCLQFLENFNLHRNQLKQFNYLLFINKICKFVQSNTFLFELQLSILKDEFHLLTANNING